MATYEVVWERPFERVQNRDAYGVGLIVNRDGQRLGLWTPMVSGIEMQTEADWGERHPAALAVLGAQIAEDSIRADRPAGWQVDGRLVPVPAREVERLAQSTDSVPEGPSDAVIRTFEAG